eukprot:GCRY01002615.1.p1 GENE.GCRY01002615.1~~GCRY01002615.1.p1  ORF type:complete len:423 (+),score=45.35 GCRY01002615.1:150-1418(+)
MKIEKFERKAKLFVANIKPTTTADDLRELFSQYGEIRDIHVTAKGSTPFAFVALDYPFNADKAKAELDGCDFQGRPLSIRIATSNSCVWVGNISQLVSDELLKDAFSQFGDILSAHIAIDGAGHHLGYGFVDFVKRHDALTCIKSCEEFPFLLTQSPKPVRVELERHTLVEEGYPESRFTKTTRYRTAELQTPPRFAKPQTLEHHFAKKYAELHHEQEKEKTLLKKKFQAELIALEEEQKEYYRREEEKLKLREEEKRLQEQVRFTEEASIRRIGRERALFEKEASPRYRPSSSYLASSPRDHGYPLPSPRGSEERHAVMRRELAELPPYPDRERERPRESRSSAYDYRPMQHEVSPGFHGTLPPRRHSDYFDSSSEVLDREPPMGSRSSGASRYSRRSPPGSARPIRTRPMESFYDDPYGL